MTRDILSVPFGSHSSCTSPSRCLLMFVLLSVSCTISVPSVNLELVESQSKLVVLWEAIGHGLECTRKLDDNTSALTLLSYHTLDDRSSWVKWRSPLASASLLA